MADSLSISLETKEVESMITGLLIKVNKPAKLMKVLERWIHAQTMKMFRGRRPDKGPIRGVKWNKLKESTIKQKKALATRGKAIVAHRPLVRTGTFRKSLRVLNRDTKGGFVYGTEVKSKKGFPYPGFHQGSRPWLFLRKKDYAQMAKATKDFLDGVLKTHKHYAKDF